jgi:thiazolylpeptide-type bacteriocin precursor
MNSDRNTGKLAREIQQLEFDAFEITDCNDPAEMLIVSTNSTSCLCSTTSSTTS